jgi:4-hydroxyphenylpyruvate dioxygenase
LNPGNRELGETLIQHGDYVKDIAFSVVDLEYLVEKARESGAKIVKDIWSAKDEHGTVRMAVVQTV